MCHVYIVIVIYSIYDQVEMDETCHRQRELHNSAASQGYTQTTDAEAGKEMNNGYQAPGP